MPKFSPRFSVIGVLAVFAIAIALAASVPAYAASLEVQAVRGLDNSRMVSGLVAASSVTLDDGSQLAAGSPISTGDLIFSGTVQNASGESVVHRP